MIATYGPTDNAGWAYSVTKTFESHDHYGIELKLLCGDTLGCEPAALPLKASFHHWVMRSPSS